MQTTTVSSKGQITIPAQLLRDLDIEPGEKLDVVPVRDGVMLLRRTGSVVDALAGSTGGIYGDVEEYVQSLRGPWT